MVTRDATARPQPAFWWALLPATLAYLAALGVPYLWDDEVIMEALEGAPVRAIFTPLLDYYFRPLSQLGWWLEVHSPAPAPLSHAVNLALHLATLAALGAWLRAERVGPRRIFGVVALGGVLPLLSETVLWACCRGDLGVALCGALALRSVARAAPLQPGEPDAPAPASPLGAALSVAGLTLLACLFKETGVAVGAAASLRAAWPWLCGRSRRPSWFWAAPLAVALAWLPLHGRWVTGGPIEISYTRVEQLWLILAVGGSRLVRLLAPFSSDLVVGSRIPSWSAPWPWLGLGALALTAWAWIARRRRPRLGFAVFLVALFCAPTSNLLPVPIFPLDADRYLYVPWLGLSLLWASLPTPAALRGPQRARLRQGGLALLITIAGLLTLQRVMIWRSPALFHEQLLLEGTEDNAQPPLVAGFYLLDERSDPAAAAPLLLRSAELAAAQGRERTEARARQEACRALNQLQSWQAASQQAARQRALAPQEVAGWSCGARALTGADQAERAVALLAQAPSDPEIHSERSRALARLLRLDESAASLERAARDRGRGPSPLVEQLRADQRALDAARARGDGAAVAAIAARYGATTPSSSTP